jgi:hypothetical protein
MEAYDRIANNQIENNGSISWIQSGLWYVTAADFKMVKPDGSSMHEHFIKHFKSTHVLVEKKK